MKIFDISRSRQRNVAVATARMWPGGADESSDIWYRVEGIDVPLGGVGDALAVGMVTPAMFEGEPLTIEDTVSKRLLANLDAAQAILSSWYAFLAPIRISAAIVDAIPPRAPGIACCFSGGVDSWYSLLKHQRRITHILLIRGFNGDPRNDVLWERARSRAAKVAEHMGKKLVTCTTNLRIVADKQRARWGRNYDGDFWGKCLHGSMLASVALTLRNEIGELIIPATQSYRRIRFSGSSPLLDPLWSNGQVAITHDGCEADRMEKVRAIADSAMALDTLRVCQDDTVSDNCGRCEKCLRTMMALRVCGALDRASTFPGGLSLADVRRLIVPAHLHHRYDEIIVAAGQRGDHELVRAMRAATGQSFSLPHATARLKQEVRNTACGRALRTFLRQPATVRSANGRDSAPSGDRWS